METLQVVPYQDGYLGVYHVRLAQRFAIRLATSTDLRSWLYQAQLDVHASMAALTRLSDGGYLLADEADNSGNTVRGQRWLRLRHYADLSNLLAANPDRTFNVPHTLAAVGRGAEGTPNIYAIRLVPDIDHSTIGIGFHYLSGGVDREARGTLTNFRSWTARPDNDLDTALSNLGMFGKHGDRDAANVRGSLVTLVECQDGVDRKWHVAMYDPTTHTARILQIKTPRGSTSFANPNIEYSSLPDGHTGIIVTLYLPLSGSAPGESGELLYYTDLPATPRAAG